METWEIVECSLSWTVLEWQAMWWQWGILKCRDMQSGLRLLLNIQCDIQLADRAWGSYFSVAEQYLETNWEMGSTVFIHSAELSPSHKFPSSGSSHTAGWGVDPALLWEHEADAKSELVCTGFIQCSDFTHHYHAIMFVDCVCVCVGACVSFVPF